MRDLIPPVLSHDYLLSQFHTSLKHRQKQNTDSLSEMYRILFFCIHSVFPTKHFLTIFTFSRNSVIIEVYYKCRRKIHVMITQKQEFICEVCGRTFQERIPDNITPETVLFIKHPVCRLHRKNRLSAQKTPGRLPESWSIGILKHKIKK